MRTVFLIAIVVCIVLVVVLKGRRNQSQGGPKHAHKYRAKKIMSDNELEFFKRLLRANPQGYVFPQVAMSALIVPVVDDQKARTAAFRRISQKRVDYAIYTGGMELLCIVELDDRTHDAHRDQERDQMLETAGIKTLRWDSRSKPSEDQIASTFIDLASSRVARSSRDSTRPARPVSSTDRFG